MKLNPIRLAMLLGGLSLSSTALCVPLSVTSANQAFSGLVLTPNAQVMRTGDFSYTYAQGVPYKGEIAELDVLKLSIGLFQGLEAHGRIVTKTYETNLYENPITGGIRDLSASFKYQLPNFYHHDNLKIAFGVQDLGGALNFFETKYAVVDYTFDVLPVRTSLGYASSKLEPRVMNGTFGGIEYQPFEFMQLIGEYDSVAYNAMIKVVTPEDFLPYGVKASLGYQLYTGHEKSEQPLWQTQISVPLAGKWITEPTQVSDNLTLQDKLTIAQQHAQSASLQALTKALLDEGFLNVQLGRYDGRLIITLENRRYNLNQVDGLGVALGIISSHYGQSAAAELELTSDKFELVALTNGIPTSKVSTSAQCYRDFLRDNIACSDLTFDTTSPGSVLNDTDWQSERQASGFGRVQLSLSPALRYGVATEYGMWDYSLALASNIYAPLWTGAALDVRHFTPVANSDDYEEGGYWQNSAFERSVDRVLAHQAFLLPYGFGYQFSFGRIYTDYEGYTHELAWYSPQGHHSFSYQYSDYEHRDIKGQEKSVSLAGYHYSRPEWDWQLDIVGGEFWNSDKGYQITTNHWFGDFNVYARYLDSQHEGRDKEQFLTLGVTFPIDVWRGMKPGYFQIRGIDRYDLSLQTRINDDHNYLNAGLGGTARLQHRLGRQYHNRGRYGTGYFENQQVRLRNAYLRYLDR